MQLNSIIFPAPPSSYSIDSEETIVWIPKKKTLASKISLISGNLITENHKKASPSFDLQGKLSPKFSFNTKKADICTFFKPKNKVNKTLSDFLPTTNFPLEKHSIMAKNALKFLILNKKQKGSSNDDYSDGTNIDSKKSNDFFATSDRKFQSPKKLLVKLSFVNLLKMDSPKSVNFKHQDTHNLFGLEDSKRDTNLKNSSTFFYKKQRSPSDPYLKPNSLHTISPINQNKTNSINFNNNQKIPCFLMQYPTGSNLLFLHFHGNAEDIGDSSKYMKKLSYDLKVLNSYKFIFLISFIRQMPCWSNIQVMAFTKAPRLLRKL